MKHALIFALALSFTVPALADGVQTLDSLGNEVRLDAPARRIVSIAPHTTELLIAAGAGQWLVGVDEFSSTLDDVHTLNVQTVGRHSNLDLERLLSLKPDLVVGWRSGNRGPQMERLQQFGVPLYLSEIREIDDIARGIEALGVLTASDEAPQAAAALRARAAQLAEQPHSGPRLRVFFQIWDQPLMTINGQHLISKAIDLCGGENIFASVPTIAPTVTVESVLTANPDVIVTSGDDPKEPSSGERWKQWKQLKAVRSGGLVTLTPSDILQRPAPRFLDGVEALCAAFDQVRAEQPD